MTHYCGKRHLLAPIASRVQLVIIILYFYFCNFSYLYFLRKLRNSLIASSFIFLYWRGVIFFFFCGSIYHARSFNRSRNAILWLLFIINIFLVLFLLPTRWVDEVFGIFHASFATPRSCENFRIGIIRNRDFSEFCYWTYFNEYFFLLLLFLLAESSFLVIL